VPVKEREVSEDKTNELVALQDKYYDELVKAMMKMDKDQWAAYGSALLLAAGAVMLERAPCDKETRLAFVGKFFDAASGVIGEAYGLNANSQGLGD
jgi:hypothetical protein